MGNNTGVTQCNGGVMSGNVSCDLSLSRYLLPKTLKKKKICDIHFINTCSSTHLILTWVSTHTQMRWRRCSCGDGGRWGTARDQSCQEHAKTRERCHRSPLLCHSSTYNEKIWADKGRRQPSVTAGGCFKFQAFSRNSYSEQFSTIQKELTSSCLMLLPVKSKQIYSFII